MKIQVKLVYPFEAAAGTSVNVGEASGEAVIEGYLDGTADTAVLRRKKAERAQSRSNFPGFPDQERSLSRRKTIVSVVLA